MDYECDCLRRGEGLKIVKALNNTGPVNRKSTADAFFDKYFTQSIFKDGEKYYRNWVETKALNMPTTDEVKEMLTFL